MNFNVLVTGALYDSAAGYNAWQFCHAALLAGHTITHVFFYQAGVSHGNILATPLADEFDAVTAWAELAAKHSLTLSVCAAASERRGVINSDQQSETGQPSHNLRSEFVVEGLASLHAASLEADRTVTFR